MAEQNIFEQASKYKLRFKTTKGQLTVEDLWDLSLEDLDDIAKVTNKKVKESSEESFIAKRTTTNKTAALQLAVLVSIIGTKLDEEEKRKLASEKRAKRQQILELIGRKQDEVLAGKTVEELNAELDALEAEG